MMNLAKYCPLRPRQAHAEKANMRLTTGAGAQQYC